MRDVVAGWLGGLCGVEEAGHEVFLLGSWSWVGDGRLGGEALLDLLEAPEGELGVFGYEVADYGVEFDEVGRPGHGC